MIEMKEFSDIYFQTKSVIVLFPDIVVSVGFMHYSHPDNLQSLGSSSHNIFLPQEKGLMDNLDAALVSRLKASYASGIHQQN